MLVEKNKFFIKEKVNLKLTNTYLILDPETNEEIAVAQEKQNPLLQILKLFKGYKSILPTKILVFEDGNEILIMKKAFSLFTSKIEVSKSTGECLGYFKTKFLIWKNWRKLFYVYDAAEQEIAVVKAPEGMGFGFGDWKFVNEAENIEYGIITKKWAGAAKELLTSADNYQILINEEHTGNPDVKMLLIAAGLAFDIIYKN